MNSARSRSYAGGYGPVGSSAIGPGRGATFEANPTKGTLVAPARFHSCYANPSVARNPADFPRRAGGCSGPGAIRPGRSEEMGVAPVALDKNSTSCKWVSENIPSETV